MDGLRERKKARVREKIVEAALQLFLARGYEGTTIDDLAAAADVSRRTVFRYFPTKEDVAFPDYAARLERFEALLGLAAAEPPLRRVQSALRGLAVELVQGRAAVLAWQRVVESSAALLAHERTLDLGWEAAIASALRPTDAAAADPAQERRVRLCAGAVFGVVRATMRLWVEGGARDDLAALGDEAFALLDGGLGQLSAPASAPPPFARQVSPAPARRPALPSSRNRQKTPAARGPKQTSKGR